MVNIIHLTVEAVEAIHDEALRAHGGGVGLRDRGLLESAVAAPQATVFGEPIFKDPFEIAAAYLFYLCSNHPFVDGNKRAALGACLVFLQANELLPSPEKMLRDVDHWEALTLDVAASRLDRCEVTNRLSDLLESAPA